MNTTMLGKGRDELVSDELVDMEGAVEDSSANTEGAVEESPADEEGALEETAAAEGAVEASSTSLRMSLALHSLSQ